MDGRALFEISDADSARSPDETSGDLFSAAPVCFGVVVMAKRPGKVTSDGKTLLPGVSHGL